MAKLIWLVAKGASAAFLEFQKILEHRGLVENCPTYALAHLGLARAYALQKDTTQARICLSEISRAMTHADPDIPILKQAKAEYAGLK